MADLKPLEISLSPTGLRRDAVRTDLPDIPVPAFLIDNVLSPDECELYIWCMAIH
jgi:hypothetical protein